MSYYEVTYSNNYLSHHGILGQKWGKKNGPPYPLSGGDYTTSEKKQLYKWKKTRNNIYAKKHEDSIIKKGTRLSTLSYNKDRTKNTDMFYATYKRADKDQYNALFNRKVPQDIYDEDGNKIGTGNFYKYKIDNTIGKDIKVASEDSCIDAFSNLFSKNRDFYNFVVDENRMQSHFVEDKYKFKGYRESRDVLNKLRSPGYTPTSEDLGVIYRMFNYVIPSDGSGDNRKARDIAVQRAKFFNSLKKSGYSAVLDTNDAIYGGFKAKAPIIVFDQSSIISTKSYRTSTLSKRYSELAFIGRRALGL